VIPLSLLIATNCTFINNKYTIFLGVRGEGGSDAEGAGGREARAGCTTGCTSLLVWYGMVWCPSYPLDRNRCDQVVAAGLGASWACSD
jgi:hypothetical protein